MNMTINDTNIFDDYVTLIRDFENAACTVDAIEGITIQFEITVENNNGEEKDFTIAFQNAERNNNIEAYNGYEVEAATMYGYDADESQELEEFTSYDMTFFNELKADATKLSEEHLLSMLAE